ncbi:hypothetical protein DFH27DRAFT_562473 [Peziza echinospora]|nr:hypothetical protein DFH27DRAFT_562473 [Peziza echinospora]
MPAPYRLTFLMFLISSVVNHITFKDSGRVMGLSGSGSSSVRLTSQIGGAALNHEVRDIDGMNLSCDWMDGPGSSCRRTLAQALRRTDGRAELCLIMIYVQD